MAHTPAAVAGTRRQDARGFSLLELMIVVIVIGIMAALAVPTMASARFDRLAYDDAGAIMQLFRSARTRAIARGGAILVAMSAAGSSDRGTFFVFEAVTGNAGAAGATGTARTPVATCKSPTNWTPLPVNGTVNANVLFIDALNLNGATELQAGVQTKIVAYMPTAAPFFSACVCYTPLGRAYWSPGGAAQFMFDGQLPMVTPLELQITGQTGATTRSVLIPPNGMARIFSHV